MGVPHDGKLRVLSGISYILCAIFCGSSLYFTQFPRCSIKLIGMTFSALDQQIFSLQTLLHEEIFCMELNWLRCYSGGHFSIANLLCGEAVVLRLIIP